jgi:hypothetical protein
MWAQYYIIYNLAVHSHDWFVKVMKRSSLLVVGGTIKKCKIMKQTSLLVVGITVIIAHM